MRGHGGTYCSLTTVDVGYRLIPDVHTCQSLQEIYSTARSIVRLVPFSQETVGLTIIELERMLVKLGRG